MIGVGNPARGDDAAGRLVARRLRSALAADIEIAETDGEPSALLTLLDGAERAILADACASGATPGTVQRFDVSDTPLPKATFSLSTHGLGLAEAIELARALGQLPAQTIVYAIEASAFEIGAPVSPAIAAAVRAAGEQIRAEVDRAGTPRPIDQRSSIGT